MPFYALKSLRFLLLFSVMILPFTSASAQRAENESDKQHKRHHLSAILGASTLAEDGETAFTFGIDYEYELTQRIGVGFVAERAVGDIDATTLLLVSDVHMLPGFVLQLGPGVEFAEGETFFVARAGLLYEIEVGDLVFAPTISYDFSEGPDAIVYGVTAGIRF